MDRRVFSLAAAVAVLFLAFGVAVYSPQHEDAGVRVREYKIDLPAGGGARIAFVSDAHVETPEDSLQLAEAVKIINRLDADYIILGGDFAGEKEENLYLLRPLLDLGNRENTFAVLGNHDYRPTDQVAEEYAEWLTANNFMVLRNQNLRRGGLCFVGLEPVRSFHQPPDRADVEEAYEGVGEECATILLAHNPELILLPQLAEKRVDLMLAGHTHGVEAP